MITHAKRWKNVFVCPSRYRCAPNGARVCSMWNPSIEQLRDYFEDTYIGRVVGRRRRRQQPLFPPPVWNVNDRIQEHLPRTNNCIEAWHRAALLQHEQGLQEFNRSEEHTS